MDNLSALHAFGLPAHARRIIRLKTMDDVAKTFTTQSPHRNGLNGLLILGGGSNTVFLNDVDTVVLMRLGGIDLLKQNTQSVTYRVMAGESWSHLAWQLSHLGLCGLENLVDIPGSVGAAPIQNIGAYGAECAEVIESVLIYDTQSQRLKKIKNRDCQFGYRDSIFKVWMQQAEAQHGKPIYQLIPPFVIVAVDIRLQRYRQSSYAKTARINYPDVEAYFSRWAEEKKEQRLKEQPKDQPKDQPLTPATVAAAIRAIRAKKLPNPEIIGNAGSFFKNAYVCQEHAQALKLKYPDMPQWPMMTGGITKLSTAWLIEKAGFKGMNKGAVGVSAQHALVLVNHQKNTLIQHPQSARSIRQDMATLIADIQKAVYQQFNVKIEPEPLLVR